MCIFNFHTYNYTEPKELLDNLERKTNAKQVRKVNERHSFNTVVIDGTQSYNCTVLIDLYMDLNNNSLYRVEQHIDQTRGYHTIVISDLRSNNFR